ncbi:CAP domain-containing protein [Oscillochloris sp. ZM17-4]|uniref:CAP domain-containing protein n=1 Tax=Oscillochloris sp. ZM17-4 TaxID=2866714 RepID=UPI001C73816B|nr:CAP domain-containing protein [Oscillochloris sp. ZM17-4]MBX0329879.1 CAP domain-containing protein [Oscillochloris sp. ZM17-4]
MRHPGPMIIIAALSALALSASPRSHAESPLAAGSTVYLPLIAKAPLSIQTPEEEAMALAVVALVNSERAAAGCAPLTVNDHLVAAAQGQSRDMAVYDFVSHTNPDPSRATLSQRATAAGYSWSLLGENVAAGQKTSAAVMSSWMSSGGHRDNILRCAYTEIGVGYYRQADDTFPGGSWGYQHYWTQVFGRP